MAGPRAIPVPLVVSFDVEGIPAPKGSVVRFGPGRYVESSPRLSSWMQAIQVAATRERIRLGRALVGPIHLDVVFRLPMPTSAPKRRRLAALADPFLYPHHTRPDVDKLLRAVGDALTRSGLIGDDGQIATGSFGKYVVPENTGATLDLWEVPR